MRDYEELVERLRSVNDICRSDEEQCMLDAADAIEELQAELATMRSQLLKWISVWEQLPEVDQPVMICAFGKSVGEGVYRGHDGFHHVWKMYASSGTYWDDEVTHYMPLPEPPKEDNNGKQALRKQQEVER